MDQVNVFVFGVLHGAQHMMPWNTVWQVCPGHIAEWHDMRVMELTHIHALWPGWQADTGHHHRCSLAQEMAENVLPHKCFR